MNDELDQDEKDFLDNFAADLDAQEAEDDELTRLEEEMDAEWEREQAEE
jgi:hypothetical protein